MKTIRPGRFQSSGVRKLSITKEEFERFEIKPAYACGHCGSLVSFEVGDEAQMQRESVNVNEEQIHEDVLYGHCVCGARMTLGREDIGTPLRFVPVAKLEELGQKDIQAPAAVIAA